MSTGINPPRDPWSQDQADPSSPYQSHPTASEPKRQGWGCWLWGCLGVVVFTFIAMIGIGYATYSFITGQVEKYTDTVPSELPVVEFEPEQLDELKQRIDTFTDTVKDDASTSSSGEEASEDAASEVTATEIPQELVLTAEEINALIAGEDELRGRLHVRIEEGLLTGQISMPTDMIPGGKGRYFNADAEFDVSLEEGILVVKLVDASVKGERIPQQILDELSNQNLAKDAYKDAKNAEILRKFESIEVVDDTVVLRLKPPAKTETETESNPESETNGESAAETPAPTSAAST